MSTRTEARSTVTTNYSHLAFLLLRTLFIVAPILFGLDKYVRVLTSDWERYLAPWMHEMVGLDAHTMMYLIGAVEIIAGLLVAFAPRLGAVVVAVWLLGIIVSLVSVGGFLDIALRDFGLMGAALALSLLAAGEGYGWLRRRS